MFFGSSERVVRGDADDAERSVGLEIANLEIRHESSSRLFGHQSGNVLNVATGGFICGQNAANMMEVLRCLSPPDLAQNLSPS